MLQKQKFTSEVYLKNRDFLIIGLTGRTGSGCSTASSSLCSDISNFPSPDTVSNFYSGTQLKKYIIAKKYTENYINSTPNNDNQEKGRSTFFSIKASNIITLHLLTDNTDEISGYLSNNLEVEYKINIPSEIISNAIKDADKDTGILNDHHTTNILKKILSDQDNEINYEEGLAFLEAFNKSQKISDNLKNNLDNIHKGLYSYLYIISGNSLRCSGEVKSRYWEDKSNYKNIYHISKIINRIIKIKREENKREFRPCHIVIDSIKNPYEAKYFKDRYSAFFLVSINTTEEHKKRRLTSKYHFPEKLQNEIEQVESGANLETETLKIRYSLSTVKDAQSIKELLEFSFQNVKKCIEISDIHIYNPREEPENNNILNAQLMWYLSLMLHPGLFTPSSMERVMQIAFSAKVNSGCISRQVGAVVTDNNNSVRAIGWNDVAKGQVPCSLRSIDGLLHHFDPIVYSNFERNNDSFRINAQKKWDIIATHKENLTGINIPNCFKDLKNETDKKGNQVHTRSLHAEENAFLQLSKYGSTGIEGGNLYTTASPCELCAKKAYQLGIKEIIFVDPYPGIARSHILEIGESSPNLIQFRGAIGKAYHRLYEQIIPIKDEISYLTNMEL